ncbi:unnamed protein product [Orchesella dallaii]|uniref:Uncharacterized protein n=1 Tax=Orchesella dallaii TaxID=48710 RepID=A0ABP1RVF0_9HEXA
MYLRLYILFVICYAALAVSAHHHRDSSEEENFHHVPHRPIPCGGGTINLGQLELERKEKIEECLDIKLVDTIDLLNSSPRRSERRQCSAECTWQAFGLITTEDNAAFLSEDEIQKFSNLFPEKAREPVKTGVEACLNILSHRQETIDHYFRLRRACDENRRLVGCLQGAVMQGCRSSARGDKHVTTTAKPIENDVSTTSTTSTTFSTTTGTNRREKEIKNEKVGGEEDHEDDDEENDINLIKP